MDNRSGQPTPRRSGTLGTKVLTSANKYRRNPTTRKKEIQISLEEQLSAYRITSQLAFVG